MHDHGEDQRHPAVKHWLDSLPSPRGINDDGTLDLAGGMFPAWKRKDRMKSVCLQGNQCFIKPDGAGDGEPRENKKKSETLIPKRVTFKTNGGDGDNGDGDDVKEDPNACTQTDFRLMRRKADKDRLELANSMNQHLIDVYQRRLFERRRPFVYDPGSSSPRGRTARTQADPISTPEGGICEHKDVRRCTQLFTPDRLDSPSTGESTNVNQIPTQGSPKPVLVCASMRTKKPTILGLVVDSASNQKPSIVRASKNANIREEFALQQKISGYRKACTHNIKSIKMAQRRLSTGLQRLRSKMAQNKMDEQQMNEFRNTSDQLFLRNKGYMPTSKESTAHFWFPPLRYQRRRMLTVH